MYKKNEKQESEKTFKEGKELESSCLYKAINKIPYLQKYKLIENERPDFILERNEERIGIEHFHIDMLYTDKKKHTGLARYTYREMKKIFDKYHNRAVNNTFDLQVAENASKDIEIILNELIEYQNKFDYNLFIKEWNRIFDKHYEKRNDYKKENNLCKVGFLIEIRRYFKYPYICHKNKGSYTFDSKNIPITNEIAESLNRLGDGIDFFIIVVEGLVDDYVSVKYYDKDSTASAQYDYFEFKKISKNFKINLDR